MEAGWSYCAKTAGPGEVDMARCEAVQAITGSTCCAKDCADTAFCTMSGAALTERWMEWPAAAVGGMSLLAFQLLAVGSHCTWPSGPSMKG